MKKYISLLLTAALLFSMLCGCAAASPRDKGVSAAENGAYDSYGNQAMGSDDAEPDLQEETEDSASGVDGVLASIPAAETAEKIIYTATADIETTAFEDAVAAVYTFLAQYDAFIEQSYVSGTNYEADYYGYQTYRTAEFTVRVPASAYRDFTENLTSLGNVISLRADAQNITTKYTDTESRLFAYRTEESRLLEMLELAETVDEMILVESRLSEVRYEIEFLTTQLRNMQSQVDYSTVYLYINEVKKLSEPVSLQRTYWQEIGDGIQDTFTAIGEFFKELFKWLVIALPVLVILSVVALAAVLLARRCIKKRRGKQKMAAQWDAEQNK